MVLLELIPQPSFPLPSDSDYFANSESEALHPAVLPNNLAEEQNKNGLRQIDILAQEAKDLCQQLTAKVSYAEFFSHI